MLLCCLTHSVACRTRIGLLLKEKKMGRPLKIAKSATSDIGYNKPDETDYFNIVGGDTTLSTVTNPVTRVRVFISGGSEENGFIVRQKGKKKYLVTGSSSATTGACVLADEADSALTEGNMTVSVILADSSEVRLARFSNRWGELFDGTRVLLNFFDTSNDTVIKSGTNGTTVDLVKVDNPSIY